MGHAITAIILKQIIACAIMSARTNYDRYRLQISPQYSTGNDERKLVAREVSSSSHDGTQEASLATDGDVTTFYRSTTETGTQPWILYNLEMEMEIGHVKIFER